MAAVSFSLNKVTLIGNLGRDIEIRFIGDNLNVGEFSIATTYKYKNRDNNWQEETTWHNIKVWNASDFLKDSLKKGKKVYAEGRLVIEKYTDKSGVERQKAVIVADRIIPLDSRGFSSSSSSSSGISEDAPENMPDISMDNQESDLPF